MKVINLDAFLEVSPRWTRKPWVEEGTRHLLGWSACPALCTEQGWIAATVKLQTSGVCHSFSLLGSLDTQYSCWMESDVFHIHAGPFWENLRAVHGQETAAPSASLAAPPVAPRPACSWALRSVAWAFPLGSCLPAAAVRHCSAALCQHSPAAGQKWPPWHRNPAQTAFEPCVTPCLHLATAKICHYGEELLPGVSQKHWTSPSIQASQGVWIGGSLSWGILCKIEQNPVTAFGFGVWLVCFFTWQYFARVPSYPLDLFTLW